MTVTTTPLPIRLMLASLGLSAAGLVTALYVLLRPPAAPRAAPDDELAALRDELASLRASVDLTRSELARPGPFGAVADLERRLANLERAPRAAPRPGPKTSQDPAADVDPAPPADVLPDGSPRYVELRPEHRAVDVEQLPDGTYAVANHDPSLAGQTMTVFALTADGREDRVAIFVPPAE